MLNSKMSLVSRPLLVVLLGAALLAGTGCSTVSPDVVSRERAQTLQAVRFAQVEAVRAVTIEGTQSGLGAVAGAVAGAAAGSSVGGKREALAVGVLGAVLGGVAGNAIERASTQQAGLEYVLRMDDGSQRVFVQAPGDQEIRVGDRVRLVGTGSSMRLMR